MQFVVSDLQYKEVFLAKPLKMTYVLFADDVSFLERTSFKFTGAYLRNIMGKDLAYGLLNGYRFCCWSLLTMKVVTHGNLHL
jgi:hypothetical protein